MARSQKYLGDRGMLLMLALTSSFPPLSTDLYLPALPRMMADFGAAKAHLNLTLSLFFIFFAVSLLIWGPLSDKYGRKPVLITGLVIYVLSSVMCALAGSISLLIVFRICQAIGGGAATAVSTAVVKDHFTGEKRATALAMIMTMVIIAPVIAPLLGAFLLKIASWHAIFWTLAGIGTLVLAVSFLLQETLQERYAGSPLASFGRLAVVLKNPGFSVLLGIFSSVTMPLMAFLAASSYIYIQGFGLSEQVFSFYFSLNALCAMAGPMLFLRLSRWFRSEIIITGCFGILAVSGFFVFFMGKISPVLFALFMGPATMSILAMRPPSANLMLEQQDTDSGSASALINCSGMIMGSMGMFLVSRDLPFLIPTLGVLQCTIGIVGGGLWMIVRKKKFIRQAPAGK